MGATDAMIANYYFGGTSGNLAAYVNRISTGVSYNAATDVFSGYKENGVRNDDFNNNPLSMGIQAEDWDYVVVESWGKDEPAGSNGDGKLSQDPNLTTLKNYIKQYAPQAEVELYHVYSCQYLADTDPAETLEALWQRYANAADEGLTEIVSKVIPAGTLIQNARLTYLNADGYNLHRNPPTDMTHLTGEGDYLNTLLMYRMLIGSSAAEYNHSSFDDHHEAFYQVLVDATLNAPSTKALTYAMVTSNETTSYFSTLSEAVTAANSGDTLTIIGMPKNADKLDIASGVTVKTYGSSEDHTIVLTSGGFIDTNGLTAKVAYTLDGVESIVGCAVTINPVTGEDTLGSHHLIHHDAVAATCVQAGTIEYWSCDAGCGKNYSDSNGATVVDSIVDPQKAHTLTKTEAKAATYTETGNNEYYTCSVCHKVFKDAEGETETTVEAETIAKLTRPSSGGSSNTTTTTTKNPDGSTTTTTTNKATGTVTETTKYPDGSSTIVETKKDGTVTETAKITDGTTGTVVTDKNGNVTEVSANVSAEAAKTGETVTLPVEVAGTTDAETATEVKVQVPASSSKVTVEIPVENMTNTTVAVLVKADGTEEVIRSSKIGEEGVVVTLEGDATVKIVDNSKDFIDVKSDWTETGIDYVTSRRIFDGTSATTFSPDAQMTRAMLMTVLARYEGEDTTGGSIWYEKGMEWAKANGISDGTNPEAPITREQMVTMLYRYTGSPVSDYELNFPDADSVSSYAQAAMRWAVENGLINGMNGKLNPQGAATRAQVAAIMMRFCENVAK